MTRLQTFLRANSLFSSLSGITFILFHSSLATLFDLQPAMIFWLIGLNLLPFAALTFWQSKAPQKKWVQAIVLMDALWVLGSVILLLLQPIHISFEGQILTAAIALIVLLLGIGQGSLMYQRS